MKYFIYQIITRDESNNWVADYRFYRGKKYLDEFDMQSIFGRRQEPIFLGRLSMKEFVLLKDAIDREKIISTERAIQSEERAKERDDAALELYKVSEYENKPKLSYKAMVFLRDSFTCVCCGGTGLELTIDHLIPLSKGGINKTWNMAAMCKPCNEEKADNIIPYFVEMAFKNKRLENLSKTKKKQLKPPINHEEVLSKETQNFHLK